MSHVRGFDHVGLTVADLDVVTAFFVALGLEVEGRTFVATWPSRSTTCRRLSTGQLPRATDWSVASASTRALGGWPTSGGRKGSSSRWPSASAEPRNARICRPRDVAADSLTCRK